jgi:hypothetical protein
MIHAPDELFSTLADPTRRAIFERLQAPQRSETCRVGARPARGMPDHYSAQPQGLAPLIDWMSLHGAFWRDRFDTLESLLDRIEGARYGWQRFVARLERVTARLG